MTGTERVAMSARMRARLGSWRVIGVFGLIYLVSQVCIGAILQPVGPLRVLRLQTTLSRSRFVAIFAQLRAEHLLHTYASHYYLDCVHPIWYGVALAALLAKGLDAGATSARWNWILYIPLLGGLGDLIENAVHIHYLATWSTTGALVVVGGLASISKWTLVAVSMVLAAWLFIRPKNRSHPEPAEPGSP